MCVYILRLCAIKILLVLRGIVPVECEGFRFVCL